MVNCCIWRYPVSQQRINYLVIVINSSLIDLSTTIWENSRPRDRKPVGINSHVLHQSYILRVSMMVINCNICIAEICNLTKSVSECVPNRHSSAILFYRSFILISRRSSTKNKALWKTTSADICR
uniref:Uncharacterized protein n=1 Tax=Opuntia streptacantha TaxID=393608 RepID=A0A7C9DFW7_OPUST